MNSVSTRQQTIVACLQERLIFALAHYTDTFFLNTETTYYSSSNLSLCGKRFIISILSGKPDPQLKTVSSKFN